MSKIEQPEKKIKAVENGDETRRIKDMVPKPKGTNAIKFLRRFRPDGPWLIVSIVPDDVVSARTFTDLEKARKFIAEQNNNEGANIYYSVNPTKLVMNKKPAKADIARVTHLHADLDPSDDETSEAFKARTLPELQKFKPHPTICVDSGNGFQLLWRLAQPIKIDGPETVADIEARNYALAKAFGASASTRNIDRILRVPGVTNYPNARKQKLGRVQCKAKLIWFNDATHPLSSFPARIEPTSTRKSKASANTSSDSELPAGLGTLLHVEGSGEYASRNELLFAFLTGAIRAHVADQTIIDACLDKKFEGRGIFEHVRENGGRKCAERQLERAHAKINSGGDTNPHSWEEPDVSLLDDRRGELPDFPLDAIEPKALRKWIRKAAHGAGTMIDHVAVPMIGITSSLIGTARRVEASPAWTQPMTCWIDLIGFSGDGKTPGINATRKPLAHLEHKRKAVIDALKREHAQACEIANAAEAKWKKDLNANHGKGKPPPRPAAADKPEKFIPPHLYTSDVTIERMAELLLARPQGMLLLVDELAGWFANMGRYSRGQDNQFWLTAWDGDRYNVERMGREVTVDHLLVGIVGGMQPDKLADSFKGADDGMYARFLYSWPMRHPLRPLSKEIGETDPKMVAMLNRLANLGGDYPYHCIKLSERALAVFERFRREHDADYNALDGREREWWAKVPNYVLRLAGTLSYLHWGYFKGTDKVAEPEVIEEQYLDGAVLLMREYFWPHARAALRQIGLTQRKADERRVLRWIKAKRRKLVSLKNIRRQALAQSLDADETRNLLDNLTKAGWLRLTELASGTRGGRPAIRWQVNPILLRAQEG